MIYLCTSTHLTEQFDVTSGHFYVHDGVYYCLQENKMFDSLSQFEVESNTGLRFIDIDDVDMNMILPLTYNYVQINRCALLDDLESLFLSIILNTI